jgi:hypothetical protein
VPAVGAAVVAGVAARAPVPDSVGARVAASAGAPALGGGAGRAGAGSGGTAAVCPEGGEAAQAAAPLADRCALFFLAGSVVMLAPIGARGAGGRSGLACVAGTAATAAADGAAGWAGLGGEAARVGWTARAADSASAKAAPSFGAAFAPASPDGDNAIRPAARQNGAVWTGITGLADMDRQRLCKPRTTNCQAV